MIYKEFTAGFVPKMESTASEIPAKCAYLRSAEHCAVSFTEVA
jgi:hypothetical protein